MSTIKTYKKLLLLITNISNHHHLKSCCFFKTHYLKNVKTASVQISCTVGFWCLWPKGAILLLLCR